MNRKLDSWLLLLQCAEVAAASDFKLGNKEIIVIFCANTPHLVNTLHEGAEGGQQPPQQQAVAPKQVNAMRWCVAGAQERGRPAQRNRRKPGVHVCGSVSVCAEGGA